MKDIQFIEEAKRVHDAKYDYSKVEYAGANKKICIICPEHGEFWVRPINHLRGGGCPKCTGKCKTTEDFIKECVSIHGDKYTYENWFDCIKSSNKGELQDTW